MHHEHVSSLGGRELNRLAAKATLHCLSGCAVGESLGLVIGGATAMSNAGTTVLSVVLAFLFGYSFTLVPLLKQMSFGSAVGVALVSDTLSIGIMEIVDNGVMYLIPGAMDAHPTDLFFWGAMALSLVLAGLAAYGWLRGGSAIMAITEVPALCRRSSSRLSLGHEGLRAFLRAGRGRA